MLLVWKERCNLILLFNLCFHVSLSLLIMCLLSPTRSDHTWIVNAQLFPNLSPDTNLKMCDAGRLTWRSRRARWRRSRGWRSSGRRGRAGCAASSRSSSWTPCSRSPARRSSPSRWDTNAHCNGYLIFRHFWGGISSNRAKNISCLLPLLKKVQPYVKLFWKMHVHHFWQKYMSRTLSWWDFTIVQDFSSCHSLAVLVAIGKAYDGRIA